jgi:hypothetical protein
LERSTTQAEDEHIEKLIKTSILKDYKKTQKNAYAILPIIMDV